MLALQIVTGVVLAMHYTPMSTWRFNSIETIMRDVNFRWLLPTFCHGASMFFVALHPHVPACILRLLQGSRRESVVDSRRDIAPAHDHNRVHGLRAGVGPDSFWAATVITNLFSAIPVVGESIVTWLWGGYGGRQSDAQPLLLAAPTLPFVIAAWSCCTSGRCTWPGRNNPAGVEPKSEKDTVAFTPYATIKDVFVLVVFCILFGWFVFYVSGLPRSCR